MSERIRHESEKDKLRKSPLPLSGMVKAGVLTTIAAFVAAGLHEYYKDDGIFAPMRKGAPVTIGGVRIRQGSTEEAVPVMAVPRPDSDMKSDPRLPHAAPASTDENWQQDALGKLKDAQDYFTNPVRHQENKLLKDSTPAKELCLVSGEWFEKHTADFMAVWAFMSKNPGLWSPESPVHTRIFKMMGKSPQGMQSEGEKKFASLKRKTNPNTGCGILLVTMIGAAQSQIRTTAPEVVADIAKGLGLGVEQKTPGAKEAYEGFMRTLVAVQELGK